MKQFNDAMEKATNVDPAFSFSQMVPLPIHEETDRTFAYSMLVKHEMNDEDGNPVSQVSAVTAHFVLVKGKVLCLWAYAEESGLEWSREASRQWASAVVAANASDIRASAKEVTPSSTSEGDWEAFGTMAAVYAITCLSIGLIVWAIKRGKVSSSEETVETQNGTAHDISSLPARDCHKTPPRKVTAVKAKNAADDRTYQYQMSSRGFMFLVVFMILMFMFFGKLAIDGTNVLRFFRAIDLGPVASRWVFVLFSLFGLVMGCFFTAIFVFTRGGTVVVCSDSVGMPGWMSRELSFFPMQDIRVLHLKDKANWLECHAINANGKAVFVAYSQNFESRAAFDDFVAQVQSRSGLRITQ